MKSYFIHHSLFAIGLWLHFIWNAAVMVQASYEPIGLYEPRTEVIDANRLDLDQQEIKSRLAFSTEMGFQQAFSVYSIGAHSKAFAIVTLAQPLTVDLAKGTECSGENVNGGLVVGKLYQEAMAGSFQLSIQYSTMEAQTSGTFCEVGGHPSPVIEECLIASGEIQFPMMGISLAYTYDLMSSNQNGRTIQSFSTMAREKFYLCSSCPYRDYHKFVQYYGEFDYADQWIQSAMNGVSTNFQNGNADFSGASMVAKAEAIQKGTAYMNVWMAVIGELEKALGDCELASPTSDVIHHWDLAVAYYTGSLVQDGIGGSEGVFTFTLAEKRCRNFKTCGENGNELYATSFINLEISRQFAIGQAELSAGVCTEARQSKERIVHLMTVPLIQSLIHYAYRVSTAVSGDDKVKAELASYSATLLPIIHYCSDEDTAVIYQQTNFQSTKIDFALVKSTLEKNYNCMGILCSEVGGLYDESTGNYFPGAEPCNYDAEMSSPSPSSSSTTVSTTTFEPFSQSPSQTLVVVEMPSSAPSQEATEEDSGAATTLSIVGMASCFQMVVLALPLTIMNFFIFNLA